MLHKTYLVCLLAIGVCLGSIFVAMPEHRRLVVSRVAIAALILQLGAWGDTGLRGWRSQLLGMPGAGARKASSTILFFMLRLVVWAVAFLMMLDNFGFNTTTLVASLGVGGIAVALATQNILGDLFASLSIMLDKPFEVGDFIIVGDALGEVEYIGLKTTRLRGLGGEQIVFSNGELLRSRIRNHKRMLSRRVAFILRVAFVTNEARAKDKQQMQAQKNTAAHLRKMRRRAVASQRAPCPAGRLPGVSADRQAVFATGSGAALAAANSGATVSVLPAPRRCAVLLGTALVISSCILVAVRSHEVPATTSRMRLAMAWRSVSLMASWRSQAAMYCSGVSAMATTSPYGTTTSVIGVETDGSSAAMYSSTLVGLMNLVESFIANGSRQTSQPARNCGSWS